MPTLSPPRPAETFEMTAVERLKLLLEENDIKPLNPKRVSRYKRLVVLREALMLAALMLLAIGVNALSMLLFASSKTTSVVSILIEFGAGIFYLVSILVAMATLFTMVFGTGWTTSDLGRYRQKLPDAVRDMLRDLERSSLKLKYTIHHTRIDPVMEVWYEDASFFIAAWRLPREKARLVDLT